MGRRLSSLTLLAGLPGPGMAQGTPGGLHPINAASAVATS